MIIPAGDIIFRAKKFIRLRYGVDVDVNDADWNLMLARVCHRMSKRLYARGHMVAEFGAGS